MASYNKMTIIGNLGSDPEMRYTPTGTAVTSFSVAVNERRRQQDGQTQESTLWFRVSCWNKLAEIASEYLHKGASVYIEGPLRLHEYTGQDGQPHTSLEITAQTLQMLSTRNGAAPDEGQVASATQPAQRPAATGARSTAHELDDVPF